MNIPRPPTPRPAGISLRWLATLASVALALAPGPSTVQSAEVAWHALTGGGGISRHGAVALGGAIGPIAPAPSPAAAGDFTLAGGFWPPLVTQPQSALPVLRIQSLGGGKVLLAWPVGVNGFVLEYTPQLGSGQWMPEPAAVVDTAVEHTVTVMATALNQAYRLRSP